MVIMANLGRFGTILSDYESAHMLGGRKRNWERDLKGLFWYMTLYATSSYEEQAGDDIGGLDAVQLMTIHQAKGLEWHIVFIPSMVNTFSFQYDRKRGKMVLWLFWRMRARIW